MKPKLLLFLLFFLLFAGNCFGQIMFQKALHRIGYEQVCTSLQITSDEGYLLLGFAYQQTIQDYSISLTKTDKNGIPLWQKTYSKLSWASSIRHTKDGGYVICGYSDTIPSIYMLKVDSVGNPKWCRLYGSANHDGEYPSTAVQTNDGGYMIVGSTINYGAGGTTYYNYNSSDVYLLKTDSMGLLQWSKTFGDTLDDGGSSVIQTSDSSYIITGTRMLPGNTESDGFMIKINNIGDTLWTKNYKTVNNSIHFGQYFGKTYQTNDGGYIISGNGWDSTSTSGYILVRTDKNGEVIWNKHYGGVWSYYLSDFIVTSDKGYALSGSISMDSSTAFVLKTDSLGDTLWTRIYSEGYANGYHHASATHGIKQTKDSGYIIGGYTSGIGYVGKSNIYLIKTDSLGNSGCNEIHIQTEISSPHLSMSSGFKLDSGAVSIPFLATVQTISISDSNLCFTSSIHDLFDNESIIIYPNPATNQLTIHTSSFHSKATVSIMNLLGQEVLPCSPLPPKAEAGGKAIDISKLPSGIYFVQIRAEKERWIGKFVKE